MSENKYVPYSKFFKSNNSKNPLPEYLRNKKENKKSTYVDYTKYSKKS